MQGTAREVEIHVEELRRIKKRMNEIMIEHTGHTLEKIEEDTDRDRFMSAEEARDYGLIDKVVKNAAAAK
jgi:ATP-dependent Clp protease protease subunit